ncbi:ketopantoate hydroxymethyltransferase [Boletus edulis BED1]|uniref:3-methyl-2-oxobutanoate hydroxymethyltransferase n=1 Tax=Boletus edulis BED1 TaxID=1328754 RepID=A0AAD4BNI1_BOLED|nr:ketopantoate hydroxymethyltransferase [Boletus edulis BED1]
MSVAQSSPPKKTTIARITDLRASNIPISVLTAYDFPTARACSAHPVDITLVGDSLAQVCLGYPSTTRLSLDEMLHHCRAVARGTSTPLLVADMPFGTYAPGPTDAVRAAVRLVHQGHVEAVKLEGGEEIIPHISALTQIGIPVMAHIGLLPQRSTALSGYRVQGRTAASANALVRAARALENAGAFAIVLEAMPSQLGEYITRTLTIPTIGIGAGPATSGQVLVWDDMLGTWHGHKAKFVRHFADVRKEVERGVATYVHAVKDRSFPNTEREGYAIDPTEWASFLRTHGQPGEYAGHQRTATDATSDSAEMTRHPESRAGALPRANETDEKTGKKTGLHTL